MRQGADFIRDTPIDKIYSSYGRYFSCSNFSYERIFKMKVTKDSLIGDILDYDVNTAQFFFEIGMHCLGCPHSRGESVAEACAVHGTDADQLVKKINDYLLNK